MVAKAQFEKIYSDGKDDKIKRLESELDSYKIALKYFTDQSQANKDIVKNLLK